MLTKNMSGRVKIVIGAMLTSFSAVFVRFSDLSPDSAAFYRSGIGAVPFLVLLVIKRENMFITGRMALLCAGTAGLFFAADLFCWHRSIHYAGVGLATLFGNFQVFFLALFGYLILKEKIHAKFILSILAALAGIFLILYSNLSGITGLLGTGLLLGIATSVFYS
jgi:drug/metabolite transporter (DMT)-like permease